MTQQQLNRKELIEVGNFLNGVGNRMPTTQIERERAHQLAEKLYTMSLYLAQIEMKRNAISDHYHNSMAHPAIKQMSAERIEQTYDRLVEQGKITVGEN